MTLVGYRPTGHVDESELIRRPFERCKQLNILEVSVQILLAMCSAGNSSWLWQERIYNLCGVSVHVTGERRSSFAAEVSGPLSVRVPVHGSSGFIAVDRGQQQAVQLMVVHITSSWCTMNFDGAHHQFLADNITWFAALLNDRPSSEARPTLLKQSRQGVRAACSRAQMSTILRYFAFSS